MFQGEHSLCPSALALPMKVRLDFSFVFPILCFPPQDNSDQVGFSLHGVLIGPTPLTVFCLFENVLKAEIDLFVCLLCLYNTNEGHVHSFKGHPPQPGKATCGRRSRLLIGSRSFAWRAGPPVCPSPHSGRGQGGRAWLWGRVGAAGPNLCAAP